MSVAPILRALASREPSCGSTKIIAIDGRSGAGKTNTAAALAKRIDAPILHLEAFYAGWHGLEAAPRAIRPVLESFAVDEPGSATCWDWENNGPGDTVVIPPTKLLIIEGVGAGDLSLRPYLSLLVWLEAPAQVRRARAIARDGAEFEKFWDVWAAQEDEHYRSAQTAGAADLVIRTI